MSIWSKILVGFIFLASLGLMYTAARSLKSHKNWMTAGQSYEKPLLNSARQSEILQEGDVTTDPPTPGIRDLGVRLHSLMVDRGRVWQGVMTAFQPDTGLMAVKIDNLEKDQLQEKTLLYVFAAPEAGGYLGEFSVLGIADTTLGLTPAMQLLKEKNFNEVERIANARQSPLTIYERMPSDRHLVDLFGNNKDALAAWLQGLPPKVADEYARDGQPAGPDDPLDHVINGKYVRQLRDYEVYFHELHAQSFKLKDDIAVATTDKAIAERTRDDTLRQVQQRKDEKEKKLEPEFAEVSAERDLIAKHLAALEARLAEVAKEEADLLAEIEARNKEWTDLQTRAAERLNELIDGANAGGS
ncbi:MAG TPA: hypothetical protein VND64_36055 [Pirellulales bacterium]|nr:hypothetical protein [Pirellulales bacterium]